MASESIPPANHTTTWLSGPLPDWLLGAGAGYLLTVPLLWFSGGAIGVQWPFAVAWVVAIAINGPHYGATLLRVYERRDERRRYAFFSLWVTLVLLGVFLTGVYSAIVGSLLVTLYFTWSPWHFAGQNYGVALLFLRRSGVDVTPAAKRLLYTSFVLSFGLAFLAFHVEGSTHTQAPLRTSLAGVYDLVRLGIPVGVGGSLMVLLGVAYVGSLLGTFALLWRQASLRALGLVASLAACQALWFVVPSLLDLSGGGGRRFLAFSAVWISAAHSLQYLWVTHHYAVQNDASTRLPSYLLRTTLVGNAAIAVPAILLAPDVLRATSWDAGLGMLIFAVVNLHHFILDGAVWKLRDGRVARLLLRDEELVRPSGARTSRGWIAFWAACGVVVSVEVAELIRHEAERRGAYAVAGRTLDAISALGRDHERARLRLGRGLLESGDFEAARRQFERSLAAQETVAGFGGLGRALEGEGDLKGAIRAYEAGRRIDPEDRELRRSIGRLRVVLRRRATATSRP
ncbi:MAG: tetratricopeptide repeat protein [Myxococcota bacterium]